MARDGDPSKLQYAINTDSHAIQLTMLHHHTKQQPSLSIASCKREVDVPISILAEPLGQELQAVRARERKELCRSLLHPLFTPTVLKHSPYLFPS